MTLNGAIMELVVLHEHPMMPDFFKPGIQHIIETLSEVEEPERRTGGWIPCSERTPEKRRETYWVCTDADSQHECRWTNNVFGMGKSDTWGWSIFDVPQYSKVLAWMPLPEPYKDGEQDGNK